VDVRPHSSLAAAALDCTPTPAQPVSNLTSAATAKLRKMIRSETFHAGKRLPPQHVLTERMGVSRSILREAVAALRAEGLLTSRRGSGVFVAETGAGSPFSIRTEDVAAVPGVVQVLELRAAVEIEAAGLAALRRTAAQAERISEALKRIDDAIPNGSDVKLDFDFHLAVAEATRNPQFPRFMEFIGGFVIPRQRIRVEVDPAAGRDAYLLMLQGEHRRIERAIRARDEVGARESMRLHLMGSARRYQRWAEEAERTAVRAARSGSRKRAR
jgi:DNA-binding FadR family transcriptional regulator